MIKSMTGFGKAQYQDDDISLDIEVKTVNSRYLDTIIRMPNQFNFLEEKLRKTIKKYISRGRVEVFVKSQKKNVVKSNIVIDEEAALDMKNKLEDLVYKLDLKDQIGLDDILRNDDVLNFEAGDLDEDYISKVLTETLEKALDQVLEMRKEEGKALAEDLADNIGKLEEITGKISAYSQDVVEEYKKKLEKNIEKILDDSVEIDADRLSNEVAFLADKADINEEIIRIQSHCRQFRDNLESENAIGKKLDFISQELLRETNTIGSKSSKIEISELVIDQKSVIEQIKEQVQNVE